MAAPDAAAAAAFAREVKVVLLGDAGVGKSSLVLRFVTNRFERYSESTIGASFMSRLMMVNGTPIKFQIWDTAGQEKYRSLAPMYYRGAAAAIIVYDITKPKSFGTLKKWVNELQTLGPENLALVVCGNKCDLEERREVATEEAHAYAESIGAAFVETSAKTARNVHSLFELVAQRLPALPDSAPTDHVDLPSGGKAGGAGSDGKGKCC